MTHYTQHAEMSRTNAPEVVSADQERFTACIHSAVTLLNKHPDTQTIAIPDKPTKKTLVEDVELPEGKSRLWISAGPSVDPKHSDQPAVSLTVEDLNLTRDKDPEAAIDRWPVTRVILFGDGTIGLGWADSAEDLDASEGQEEYPEDNSAMWSEIKTDTMTHNHPQKSYATGDIEIYDDWQHVQHAMDATDALLLAQ